MSSIIEGYNYDIFISYRQKDNKGDMWVSQFVQSLKTELESTFKEDISVYFDINPHDGLLETHDVDASLKEKLKCLVFIPIISRTYCDPKSFAWEHEFKAFVEQASKDQFGLKVKLTNGNVANRVLPIRIHDLDIADIKEFESVLGGVLRGIEFIYKEPGVNKPLTVDDDEKKNLNNAKYRIQINKTANAVKEIISGLKKEPIESVSERKEAPTIEDKPLIEEKSIIVLPFENISPDPDQEYFSDGLTEEIITDLSHIHDLLVISRSSAMTFKGTKKTIPEIAQAVKVRYVLEGSVRKAGNNLRITAQLIDSITDAHIWAEKYSGSLDDIFDIQEKVSKAIVTALKLTTEESRKLTEKPIANATAYECYLKAMSSLDRMTENGFLDAIRYLEHGLQIIGENSLIYYGLGYTYWCFANHGVDMDKNLLKCKESANMALSLDPESTRARALLGFADVGYSDWKQTLEGYNHLKKVLKLDPNEPLALLGLSIIYVFAGRFSDVSVFARKYIEREPLINWASLLPIYIKWFDGKYENSFEDISRFMKNFPSPVTDAHCAWGFAWAGRTEEALKLIGRSVEFDSNHVHTKLGLILKYGLQRDAEKMRSVLDSKLHNWCLRGNTWSYFLASAFSLANANDESLNWLEHAVDLGWINYPLLAEKDPFLVNIRGEERFKKLIERVKYEWENFEV